MERLDWVQSRNIRGPPRPNYGVYCLLDDADHFSEGLNSAFVEDIRASVDKALVVFRKELGGAARKDGLMAVDQSASVAAKVRKARSALYAVALEALAAEGIHVKFDSKEVPCDETE